MGIFSRLGTLIKSNINDMISKAEDPEKMLSQVLVDMKQQLIEAKKQVAVFRVKVLELDKVPAGRREELYRRLLELNAQEMLHGAYGLEQGAVVVTDALQLENLDFNEFQATLDDIGLAVTNHYPELTKYAAA